jgi:hypothetical protein
MIKSYAYIIVVLIVLLSIFGTNKVQSRVVDINRPEPEKVLVQKAIEMEGPKQKILNAIIACESSNRHVIGTLSKRGIDIGKCQINTYWHEESAASMGLNLYDPADNMEYCLFLFESEGVKPWRSSQVCWSQELEKENILF